MMAYPESNDKLKFVGLGFAKPLNELFNPFLYLGLRVIAEQLYSLGDVSESLGYVSGLQWLLVDLRLPIRHRSR